MAQIILPARLRGAVWASAPLWLAEDALARGMLAVDCTRQGGTCYPCCMTDGAIETVLGRTSQEEIHLVRFLYADHGGIIRGKAAGTARLRERMSSGIGHTVAMMAMSMLDHLQPVPGMGPVGEVRILPDPETFVPLPYAPGAGAMLADLVKPDGSPWEACARTFLKQAIADLAGEGYAMQAAFEPEFTIGRRESSPAGPSIPDRLIPIDDSLCYSSTGFHLAHDFAMELVRRWRRRAWSSSTTTPSS